MNKHRQALSLLKAGLSPILVNIQTGLAIDHTLMSADMKARVVSDQSSKKLPTLDDILGAPQGASDAAVLLLLYTAKSECAELEVDIHKLVSAHEDYLRECRLVSRSGAPPPLSLDDAWILARELQGSDQISLLNKILSYVVKGH